MQSKHKHSFSQEEVRGSDVFCVIRNKANTVSTMVLILLEVLYHINILKISRPEIVLPSSVDLSRC